MDHKVILLDGAMGTQLQSYGLKPGEIPEVFGMLHPEVVEKIHQAYIDAGSDIIYANTFGANGKKLKNSGYTVKEVIQANLRSALKVADGKARVALDIGPIGELLEPNGYLKAEDAYEIYKEMIEAASEVGIDLVVFETMSDLMEIKMAILAAKENSDMDIFVTMSFEADMRSFTGCCVESFAFTCDRLGVDALGVNCSLGPDELLPIIERMAKVTNLPLIVKANAGLPDPITNTYSLDATSFATSMRKFNHSSVKYVGGCCGSEPSFIKELKALQLEYVENNCEVKSYVCTPTTFLCLDDINVIGERINPTGNKVMKQALLDHDIDKIIQIALEQVEAGAKILDVNVGLAGIDEKAMMVEVVKELQGVVDVPLQIDSTNPDVIEAALRIYHGIPNVNSINGEHEIMDHILPHIAKYGANVIALALDENGISDDSYQRYLCAKDILTYASKYGISKERIFVDCLVLTVSAQPQGAKQTIDALKLVKEKLNVKTCLGVSNISFGLPRRLLINQAFLTLALQAGLDMPIINPNQEVMMQAVDSFRVLNMLDDSANDYIEKYANTQATTRVTTTSLTIQQAVIKGLKEETRSLCAKLLINHEPLEIVNEYLIPALDEVGELFEAKKLYLPQLINAANASQQGFDEIKQHMQNSGQDSISKGKILLATVEGDVHDIGKNIVKIVLENYGFEIYDLGKDVASEKIVEVAIKENIYLIGLSALMTTTLKSMEKTVKALHEANHPCKIMVGGAVVSREYAQSINADYYAKDAKQSADIAKEVFNV